MEILRDVLQPKTRQYLYRIVVTLVPILSVYGIVDQQIAPLILSAVAAVLAIAVADGNVTAAPVPNDVFPEKTYVEAKAYIEVPTATTEVPAVPVQTDFPESLETK